ncbi:MAG: insulinase family protein [Alphaproteobacteria bacterium]|nr:MAG: insulinase family protein [Alphaproteobacteria bacterium]
MTLAQTTLSNGVRVVTETMAHLATATVGVWANVGARHEKPSENGLSHMLEHMAFKGTGRRTARAIAEEIEAVGGDLNAYTTREHTVYYARVLKDDVPLAFDILGDILLNSTFDQEELERERQVILQEIGQAHDTPDDLVFDLLQEAAYPDQSLGRPILGTVDTVTKLDRKDLRGYLGRHYRAQNIVVVATGHVDHAAVVRLAEDLFGGVPSDVQGRPEPAVYKGGSGGVSRDLEQVHLTLGFEGVSYADDDFYTMQVYSMVLGGGMSSRLFQEVREVRGLAYSVYSFVNSYADGGTIGVYAGTGAGEMDQLLPVIVTEMKKIGDHLDEDEVARARAQLKAGVLMSLESSAARMEQIGRQMLVYGRVLPTEELIAAIDAVDAERVINMGRRLVTDGRLCFASVGPFEAREGYERLQDLLA